MEKEFICEYCNIQYSTKFALTKHQNYCKIRLESLNIKQPEIPKVECDKCHQIIGKNNFNRHYKLCDGKLHGVKEKQNLKISEVFECNDCSKLFNNAQSLNAHFDHCERRRLRLDGKFVSSKERYSLLPQDVKNNMAWRKNQTTENNIFIKNYYGSLEDILANKFYVRSVVLKDRLVKAGVKKLICEECGNAGVWNNKPITMELHHVDGNRYNNELSNLQILCPNCHSQTFNYRNKENSSRPSKNAWMTEVEILERIDIIERSDINFSKWGWKTKICRLLDLTPHAVTLFMKHHMKDFYYKKCYIRA